MLDVCECMKPDSYVGSNIDDVMNGKLEGFVTAYLKMQ